MAPARLDPMFDRLSALLAAQLTLPASWPAALVASALVLVVGLLAASALFRVLGRLTTRTATELDDLLVRRMRVPARLLVALAAVHLLLTLRGVDLAHLRSAITGIELLLLAYLVIETAETFFFHWWLHERKQTPVPAVVRHLVLIVVYTAAILTVLGSVTGLDLLPVLATSTVVTVVVGLALQDTLGNLFSGLALHIERPFGVGDWILVEGVEGQVAQTGWRATHLRTLSGDMVAFPNSVIARARVQNFSAPDPRTARLVEISVRVSAAPDRVEEALRAAYSAVPNVRAEPTPRVWLLAVNPLVQRWVIKFWVDDFRSHDDIESDLQKAAWRALRAADLQLREPLVTPSVGTEGQIVASVGMKFDNPEGGGHRTPGG